MTTVNANEVALASSPSVTTTHHPNHDQLMMSRLFAHPMSDLPDREVAKAMLALG
ncbi:MAG: hypothetical protein ABI894_04480 [Ilumatobacteraceae bacterium]